MMSVQKYLVFSHFLCESNAVALCSSAPEGLHSKALSHVCLPGLCLAWCQNSLRGSWKEMEQLLLIACFSFSSNVVQRYIPRF